MKTEEMDKSLTLSEVESGSLIDTEKDMIHAIMAGFFGAFVSIGVAIERKRFA